MKRILNKTVEAFEESIFSTMSRLSAQNNAINLSQGFPDFQGPEWIRQKACEIINHQELDFNQYALSQGVRELRLSLKEMMHEEYSLDYDHEEEITVTNGATEAIFLSALALFNPGDEVIIFEPFYDSYVAALKLAGLKPKVVTLHAPEYTFNEQELKQCIGPKLKGMILNDPHNPSARVFTKKELTVLASFAEQNDLLVVSDNVYEFLCFDKNRFIPFASLPNMHKRTVHISSSGKTFGLTGWKVGWAMAPAHLSSALRKVHQFNTFCVAHPLQKAIAFAISQRKDYLQSFQKNYQEKRDEFVKGLKELGLRPVNCEGTYFVMCPVPDKKLSDIQFCEKLIIEHKVSAIPPSAFYLKSDEGKSYVRFCFAKKQETLRAALKSLQGVCNK